MASKPIGPLSLMLLVVISAVRRCGHARRLLPSDGHHFAEPSQDQKRSGNERVAPK